MDDKEKELELVTLKRGKWSHPGVPHKGWTCVEIEDLGSPSETCQMCESQDIRYVHYMSHPKYHEVLAVGCICAGHMEGDLVSARERDSQMHSRAGKRKRWLDRVWKVSRKGNDYIKTDGYIVTAYRKHNGWGATIAAQNDSFVKHIRQLYKTQDQAKLAAFDEITKLLA